MCTRTPAAVAAALPSAWPAEGKYADDYVTRSCFAQPCLGAGVFIVGWARTPTPSAFAFNTDEAAVIVCGWPLQSFSCCMERTGRQHPWESPAHEPRWSGAVAAPAWLHPEPILHDAGRLYWAPDSITAAGRPLPIRPLVLGLVVNSIIYALLILAASRAMQHALGTLRTRRSTPPRLGNAAPRRRWRQRHPLTLAYALLLGTIINSSVAWALALWSPAGAEGVGFYTGRLPTTLSADAAASSPETSQPGDELLRKHGIRKDGAGITLYLVGSESPDGSTAVGQHPFDVLRSGWPFESLSCRREFTNPAEIFAPAPATDYMIQGGVAAPAWARPRLFTDSLGVVGSNDTRPIPLTPRWGGMVAGALFYAAILVGLLETWRTARALVRRRRNRCPTCAYQLTGEPICPECGTTLSPRTPEPQPRNAA
jgi:hypothetical protein